MIENRIYQDRWVTEKEAAQHFKLKPSTLRKRRSLYGKDTTEIWTKLNGRVLYDLFATDQRLEKKGNSYD
jgi:hypothetical protein|tara:strand:- start:982 stop:1191 length:210 start_codon:yes stop_codon:yes gene_type:complete